MKGILMQPSSQLSLDDGFQFGLGAFETIAIEHGQPVFPEKHLARLDRQPLSCSFLPAKRGTLHQNGSALILLHIRLRTTAC